MDNDKVISTLNSLIETCKDGQEGFRTAAEAITQMDVRSQFERFGRERAQCAAELQTEVRRLGGDPEKTSSMAGSLHRGWINMKSLVTGKDEAAVIAEAERGEDVAVKYYQEALAAGLPAEVQSIVQRQFTQVKAAHDRVRQLELTRKS